MLATSVAVVRKMLEAVAGSAPSLRRVSGIIAPEMPLTMQLAVIAMQTTSPSITGQNFVVDGGMTRKMIYV